MKHKYILEMNVPLHTKCKFDLSTLVDTSWRWTYMYVSLHTLLQKGCHSPTSMDWQCYTIFFLSPQSFPLMHFSNTGFQRLIHHHLLNFCSLQCSTLLPIFKMMTKVVTPIFIHIEWSSGYHFQNIDKTCDSYTQNI